MSLKSSIREAHRPLEGDRLALGPFGSSERQWGRVQGLGKVNEAQEPAGERKDHSMSEKSKGFDSTNTRTLPFLQAQPPALKTAQERKSNLEFPLLARIFNLITGGGEMLFYFILFLL